MKRKEIDQGTLPVLQFIWFKFDALELNPCDPQKGLIPNLAGKEINAHTPWLL